MPAKSPAQLKLMRAVAHSAKFAKKVDIPQAVGREFSTPGYALGGKVGALQACTCGRKMADGGFVERDVPTMSDQDYYRYMTELATKQRGGGRRPESLNASRGVNLPGQLARGWAAGTLGLPGDIESLGRGLGHLITQPATLEALRGAGEAMKYPTLPNTAFYQDWLPGKDERPLAQLATETGAFAGGVGATKVAQGAVKAGRVAKGALGALADEVLTPVPRRAAQLGAVRLKGGNFNESRLAGYLGDPLNIHTPEYMDFVGDPPQNMRPQPVQDWGAKQLKNYIAKDLGSPTDPLLAVEKDLPGLHLPEGELEDAAVQAERVNRMRGEPTGFHSKYSKAAKEHYALTDQPLTPWGKFSSDELVPSYPHTYVEDITGTGRPTGAGIESDLADYFGGEVPPSLKWLGKAPPDTKIWGLMNPQSDPFHFGHVLDYLEAATDPYRRIAQNYPDVADQKRVAPLFLGRGMQPLEVEGGLHPYHPQDIERWRSMQDAGLTLDPASLSRLSVADAVKKTAQWNKYLAENGTAAPGLEKGWQVHKEYGPESGGMKWVKFGEPKPLTELPEGARVVQVPKGSTGGEGWIVSEDGGPIAAASVTYDTPEKARAGWLERYGARGPREALSEGLNAEGKAMGHCVGGYCDQVARDGTQIYSLRDAKGNPHVTVEVRPKYEKSFKHWMDNMPNDMYQAYTGEFLAKNPGYRTLNGEPVGPEWATYMKGLYGNKPPEYDIVQIKGKQNAAPVEKYLPYVQDFVKGGQWGRVGDLQNSGLTELKGKYFTQQEIEEAARKVGHPMDPNHFNMNYFSNAARAEPARVHRTAPEDAAVLRQLGVPGFAHGGSVQSDAHDPHDELDHAIDVACINLEGAH